MAHGNYKTKPFTLVEYAELQKKRSAVSRVNQALKSGDIVKTPCMACGEATVEAHHVDYDAPLSVVWLCKGHHEQAHHPGVGKGARFAAKEQDACM